MSLIIATLRRLLNTTAETCRVFYIFNMCNWLVINLFYTQSNKDSALIKCGEFIDQPSDSYCLIVLF